MTSDTFGTNDCFHLLVMVSWDVVRTCDTIVKYCIGNLSIFSLNKAKEGDGSVKIPVTCEIRVCTEFQKLFKFLQSHSI